MTHPLTNKKLFKKFWDHTVDVTTEVLYTPDGMRAAYDMGRKKGRDELLVWLSKNLKNYTDAPDHWGGGRHIDYLIKDLVLAMCPQENNS
jgi:hypothetical protein